MELTPATASGYVRLAFDQMLAVAGRLDDGQLNERPLGPTANAVGAVVIHCCGVSELWLGQVGLGRERQHEREPEFSSTATMAELRALVAATVQQVEADLAAPEAGADSACAEGRLFLRVDPSDASLVLHGEPAADALVR